MTLQETAPETVQELAGDVLAWDVASVRALFAPVVIAASRDGARPTLCAVLVESTGDTVTATATDLYRLHTVQLGVVNGAEWVAMIGGETFATTLDADGVRNMLKGLGTVKRGESDTVLIRRDASWWTVERPGRGSWVLPIVAGAFPNWRTLLPADGETGDGLPAFNPAYLAGICDGATAFAKALGLGDEVPLRHVHASERKPSLYVVTTSARGGAQYRALIMPMRT